MGNSEIYMANHRKRRGDDVRKVFGGVRRGVIEDEERDKKSKTVTKGPRALFVEKYKVTGDVSKARKELEQDGISLECFEDNILNNWIEEDVEK